MTAPTPRPLRVLLVDAHPAFRDALALLLTPAQIHICAQANSCAEALLTLQHASPDVAVMDLSHGCQAALTLLAELDVRGVPALVYSAQEYGEDVRRALVAGARGYITKRELHRVLIDAIGEVAAGREYLGPRAASALAARLGRMRTHDA